MSNLVFYGGNYSYEVDLHSLAAIFYHLLVGEPPFSGKGDSEFFFPKSVPISLEGLDFLTSIML
jgi:serine/threonine protein kinase